MKKIVSCFLSLVGVLTAKDPVIDLTHPTISEIVLSEQINNHKEEAVHESKLYIDIGTPFLPLPLPIVGIGFRSQWDKVGFDASVHTVVLLTPLAFQEKAELLYFPNPDLSSQWYLGGGLSMAQVRDKWSEFVYGPSLSLGKEFITDGGSKRFFQGNIDFFISPGHNFHTFEYPLVTLQYGFGF